MNQRPILTTVLAKQNLLVSVSLILVVLFTGIYTILGIGMNMSALDMTRMSGVLSMPDSGTSMNMEMEGKMSTSMPSKDITSKSELSNNIAQDQSTMKMGDNSRMEMETTWSFNFTILMFLMCCASSLDLQGYSFLIVPAVDKLRP